MTKADLQNIFYREYLSNKNTIEDNPTGFTDSLAEIAEQYANDKVEKIIEQIEYDDYDSVDDLLSFLRSQTK